jgi:hypothetical protein
MPKEFMCPGRDKEKDWQEREAHVVSPLYKRSYGDSGTEAGRNGRFVPMEVEVKREVEEYNGKTGRYRKVKKQVAVRLGYCAKCKEVVECKSGW